MDSATTMTTDISNKRTRSPSFGDGGHPAKMVKTHSNHLQINYLARQYNENIPLVNAEDTLPSILRLIGDYDGVLHRHESIAGNLGACPLGPILMKRFERLFDGPPRILKSHGKDATVTWLDVVEFARNKPEQFNLEKTRNGVRVCQFYTKQSRVEISEEDYVLIASGMPQKLIPPQPIIEDEEKELSALDILERNLSQIISLADQVSARARQLNHRLKNRKAAIMSRRAESDAASRGYGQTSYSPPPHASDYGNGYSRQNGSQAAIHSPPTGFTSVNVRSVAEPSPDTMVESTPGPYIFSASNPDRVTVINGTNVKSVSPEYRSELVKQFISSADRDSRSHLSQVEDEGRVSQGFAQPSPSTRTKPRSNSMDYRNLYQHSPSGHVAIPNTPASLLPYVKPSPAERDDGGPYKAEMVARMEQMHRGERVIPPCDRCRRLHMDCLKNLTACMGCTKKHAKCSWKDVREEELREGRQRQESESSEAAQTGQSATSETPAQRTPVPPSIGPYPTGATSPIAQPQPPEQSSITPSAPTNPDPAEEDDITRAILEEKEDSITEVPDIDHKHNPPDQTSEPPPHPASSSTVPTPRSEQQLAGTAAKTWSTIEAPRFITTYPHSDRPSYQSDPPPLLTSETSHPLAPPPRNPFSSLSDHAIPTYNHRTKHDNNDYDDDEALVEEDEDSDDDGDRLQKAAAQVYRSASMTRPSMSSG